MDLLVPNSNLVTEFKFIFESYKTFLLAGTRMEREIGSRGMFWNHFQFLRWKILLKKTVNLDFRGPIVGSDVD